MLLNKLTMLTTMLLVLTLICFGGLCTHQMAEARQGRADQPTARGKTGQKDTGKEGGTGPKDTTISKLQGKWVAVSAEANGGQLREKVLKECKPILVVSGDKFTATALLDKNGEVSWKGTIQFDSTKLPLRFDSLDGRLEFAKTKGVMKTAGVKGIYELKGDTLKICYGPERPTEFKTKPDSFQRLFLFKREKKEKVIPRKQPDNGRERPVSADVILLKEWGTLRKLLEPPGTP